MAQASQRNYARCCGVNNAIIHWTDSGPWQYGAECAKCGARILLSDPGDVFVDLRRCILPTDLPPDENSPRDENSPCERDKAGALKGGANGRRP